MTLIKFWHQYSVSRVATVLFLLLLVGIGAIPSYRTGEWIWAQPPSVSVLKQLKQVRQTGLIVPGWQTLAQSTVKIGGHNWSAQIIDKEEQKPVTLLLLPQNDSRDQPDVEWMDINGIENWKTDSYKKIEFTFETESGIEASISGVVKARFFRAWNQRQTFAVLQWYAWRDGGHFAPAQWFWVDQFAQLFRRRVPWTAVCLKIPIQPLDDLEAAQPLVLSLARTVQATLVKGYLSPSTSNP